MPARRPVGEISQGFDLALLPITLVGDDGGAGDSVGDDGDLHANDPDAMHLS